MNILLVEDHAVVREGLRRLLAVSLACEVSEADNVGDALTICGNQKIDLVVLDLNLNGAGGLEMMRRLPATDSAPKVVVFTMHADPMYAARALKAGAHGYVSKSAPVEELIKSIKIVKDGGIYVDQGLAAAVGKLRKESDDPLEELSMREVEILRLLGQGKSLTAIAEALGVAYKTVANNCTQMKMKLGVERTADLIRLGVQNLQS